MSAKMLVVAACALVLSGCVTAPETVESPNWVGPTQTPSGQELTPEKASDRGVEGVVLLECRAAAEGRITDCSVVHEEPKGWGFAAGAMRASEQWRQAPEDRIPEGATVALPIAFCSPSRTPCGASKVIAEWSARRRAEGLPASPLVRR